MSSEWEYMCGRCGMKIPKSKRVEGFNSTCSDCGFIHVHLSRRGDPPLDDWECVNCGEVGTFDEVEATPCPHRPSECVHCGLTPYCAPDCGGLGAILGDPKVYLAGFRPE